MQPLLQRLRIKRLLQTLALATAALGEAGVGMGRSGGSMEGEMQKRCMLPVIAALLEGYGGASHLPVALAIGMHGMPVSGVGQRGKQNRRKGKMEEMGVKVLSCPLGGMVDGKLAGARCW